MYFSSPIMLWKMFFFLFGIWTINVPEVILYNGSDINRFMGFVFNFEVEVFELVFVFDSKTVLRQEDHRSFAWLNHEKC